MEYEDFSIKIEPKQGDIYPVIVLRSPAGEGRSEFRLPFELDQLGNIVTYLDESVRGRPPALRKVSLAATATIPQRIGDQLFTALFTGSVLSLFERSMGMLHGQSRGLRIKLHIDPEDNSLAPLASLPWEFLYRKETREFLNLSQYTPIVRYLDVQRAFTPLKFVPPLRILVVMSDPVDFSRLDLNRERENIDSCLTKMENIQVEFIEHASVLMVQECLGNNVYHVLHYLGHGGFDEGTGQGVLVMEGKNGQAEYVDGGTLGVLLHDVPTLSLVFLNACETARVSRESGLDPFAGVSSALVMAGIPAVVAMQFHITDRAAITFSQRFYALLSRGYPVDTAVAGGRQSIRILDPDNLEWGTPVLFMRAPQGVIFQVPESPQSKNLISSEARVTEGDRELDRRVEQLYNEGLAAYWLEEWEKAVHYFQSVYDLHPDYYEITTKLQDAQRQLQLNTLYDQSLGAEQTQDWKAAITYLDQIATIDACFRDVSDRLEKVRKRKHLSELYEQARRLSQSEQWEAVMKILTEISTLEPQSPDPDGLLPKAQEKVAELKHQAEIEGLYNRSLRELDKKHWQEAESILTKLQEIKPGYRGADRLLAKAQVEISRQKADKQKQEQLASLYEQAILLASTKQWNQAQIKISEIQAIDPNFPDPDGIAERSKFEVALEEEENHRKNLIKKMYSEAYHLFLESQYQDAIDKLSEIYKLDSNFQDIKKIEITARNRLGSRPSKNIDLRTRLSSKYMYFGCIGLLVLPVFIYLGYLILNYRSQAVIPPAVQITAENEVTEAPTEAPAVTEAPTQVPTGGEAPFPVMPGGELEKALTGAYSGTTVTVDGLFTDPDDIRFANSIKAFEEATGIDINYIGDKEFEARISVAVDAGNPPDVADFPQPGKAASFARQGQLVDPTTWISEDWLKQQYNQSWLDMATVEGPDGNPMTAGVWHRFYGKSLVWYPKDDFDAAGYTIPTTWDELLALTQQIAVDGDTAWCIGIESGAATGWAATDWTEDVMLRTTSLENYDAWVAGELPFSSPEVKNAILTWGGIWLNPDYVFGGTDGIVSTYFGDAPAPMFEDPPRCWLHKQGNFITGFFPEGAEAGVDYDFFYFPPIDDQYGKPFLVAGDMFTMFNDRPEVRAFMEYLTVPESASGWLENSGALAAHQTATPDMYGQDLERGIAELAAEATAFRFDGSDLMPGEVGSGSFWTGMTDYVSGAADLDTVLAEIDASNPNR